MAITPNNYAFTGGAFMGGSDSPVTPENIHTLTLMKGGESIGNYNPIVGDAEINIPGDGFVCSYGTTTAAQIRDAKESGKEPYLYHNGIVVPLWKIETSKYTFRTTSTREVEGATYLDIVDYAVEGSTWSTVTHTVSGGGGSSQQAYLRKVTSFSTFDTTGLSGMRTVLSVNNVPSDGVYQVSVMLSVTPKTSSPTKSDLVFGFYGDGGTGMPSQTFHAVVDDSQTFAQQLSFSTTLNLAAGTNSLKLSCDGLNTNYLVFVDDLTVAQLVNGVYHNGDDFDDVHTLTEAPNFNNDDGVLVDGATGGPRFMLWQTLANKVLGFIKSLSTTITAFRSGDVIPVDGPSGTAKMGKDDLLKETAENAKEYIKPTLENCIEYINSGYVTTSVSFALERGSIGSTGLKTPSNQDKVARLTANTRDYVFIKVPAGYQIIPFFYASQYMTTESFVEKQSWGNEGNVYIWALSPLSATWFNFCVAHTDLTQELTDAELAALGTSIEILRLDSLVPQVEKLDYGCDKISEIIDDTFYNSKIEATVVRGTINSHGDNATNNTNLLRLKAATPGQNITSDCYIQVPNGYKIKLFWFKGSYTTSSNFLGFESFTAYNYAEVWKTKKPELATYVNAVIAKDDESNISDAELAAINSSIKLMSKSSTSVDASVYRRKVGKRITNASIKNQSAIVVGDEIWLSNAYEKDSVTMGQVIKIALSDVLNGNGENVDKGTLERVFHNIGHGGLTSYCKEMSCVAGCTYGDGSVQDRLVILPVSESGNYYTSDASAVNIDLTALLKDSSKSASFIFGEQPCIGYIRNGDYVIKVLLGITGGAYDGTISELQTFNGFTYRSNAQEAELHNGKLFRLVGSTTMTLEKWALVSGSCKLQESSSIDIYASGSVVSQEPEGICFSGDYMIVSSLIGADVIGLNVYEM